MKCSKCGFEFTDGIFCPECGMKNELEEFKENDAIGEGESEDDIVDIDKAFEDIMFYYEQSRKKKEAAQKNDHLYYDRAQKLLQKMIKQKVSDYRVWWEACKPIDFWENTFSEEMIMKYKINDTYFAKALDYADIEAKKRIVEERNSYQERKRNIEDEMNRKRAEVQRREEERKKAKEAQRQKEIEEQKERDRIEYERQKEDERINQEQRKVEKEGKAMAIMSLIFGIISLCTFGCWFFPEILGIVFALMGKKQGVMRGQAKAGLICSCISIVIVIGIFILGMSL